MKNTNSNGNNNDNNATTKTQAQLLEDLSSQNQTIALIYIIIISILLDLINAYNDRATIIDQLVSINYPNNGTSNTTTTTNATNATDNNNNNNNNNIRVFAKTLALLVAIAFAVRNANNLDELLNSSPIDEQAINDAKRSLLVSLLALAAAKITHGSAIFEEV